MTTGQIIVCVLSAVLVGLVIAFFNKLPQKLRASLTHSLVFVFTDILFINFLRSQLDFLVTETGAISSDAATFITALVLIGITTTLSFLLNYLLPDPEKARKIFFRIAAFVFAIAYLRYTFGAINMVGAYPSHLCRIISYSFPLVYFLKQGRVRTTLLAAYIYSALVGALATIYAPDNFLHASILNWGELDTVLTHVALLLVPTIILTTREIRPTLHHIWQFVVFLGACTLFALFSNFLDLRATGTWGNGMYLTEPALEGLPTPLFALACVVIVVIIIVPFNIAKIKALFVRRQKPQAEPGPDRPAI